MPRAVGAAWLVVGVALLCFFPASASAEAVALQFREPFADGILDEHVALIAGFLGLTGVMLLAAVAFACLKTLRLTAALVLCMWLSLICIGTVSWVILYTASRRVIIDHIEHILVFDAGHAVNEVSGDLGAGVGMLQLLQHLARPGHLDMEATWPAPHVYFDRVLRSMGSRSQSVDLLYWGSEAGRLQGVTVDHLTSGDVRTDLHFTLPLVGDPLAAWVSCAAADWSGANCSGLASPQACSQEGSEASVQCASSCGFPSPAAQNCVGRLVLFTAAVTADHAWAGVGVGGEGVGGNQSAQEVIFTDPIPDHHDVIALEFDPRLRPWYTRQVSPVWSAPYSFATGAVGFTASAAVLTPSGEFLGAVAVDFTLESMNRILREVKPFDDGVAFLVTEGAILTGSSFTLPELIQDTGQPSFPSLDSLNVLKFPKGSGSAITTNIRTVLSRWGSIHAASAANSLYQDGGRVVVSFPIRLKGLTMLLVVAVSLSDVMGEADRASIISLVLTFSISIGVALLMALGMTAALRPLSLLREEMQSVARMRFDGERQSAPSSLTEIRCMQESFSAMVDNLREYKQYLPQSVLAGSDEEEEAPGVASSLAQRASVVSSREASSTHSQQGVSLHEHVVAGQPRVRSVSIVVTNMKGFILASRARPQQFSFAHVHYLETVVRCVNAHRGIVDEFMGDKVHSSFNTVIPTGAHKSQAVECLRSLQGTGLVKLDNKETNINGAAVSMHALCGNMGCKGLRKYTIAGTAGGNVWTFERWGRAWGVPMVVDTSIAEDTETHFDMRLLAKVRVSTRSDTGIYELVGEKNANDVEWMYALHSASSKDPCVAHNVAVELLYDGAFHRALEVLGDREDHAELSDWVRVCKSRNAAPRPIPVTFAANRLSLYSEEDYAQVPDDLTIRDMSSTV